MAVPLWLLCGLVCACGVGFLAARIHASGHAPVGLVSLGIGVLLGCLLNRFATILRIAGGRFLLASTVLLAVVTVASEHAWLYHDFRRQWSHSRETSAAVAMFRPESPPGARAYFAHEWRPALWSADAALIAAAAAAAVFVGQRRQK